MIQSKTSVKKVIPWACAVLTAALSFSTQAQSLSQKWVNTAVAATSTRDLAYNIATKNILLVHTTPKITRWKSSDGTTAGSDLDITAVSGGTFALAGIATLNDGTIFACNYVVGAQSTTPLKIYRWDNENATPTNVASLATLPGASTDRFGAALKVFVTATTTNLLIAGNATTSYLLINSGTNWTFKQLTGDSQVMTPGGTFVDYNAPGFANQFRIIGKSRGSSGLVYNFDPTTAGTITLTTSKTAMSGEFAFKANGITSHDYDPNTGLLAGTTSTLQAGSAFDYTNMIFTTVGGVAVPVEVSRLHFNAGAADGGTAGGTKWGADGRLYATIPVAGVGLQAFDISVFLVRAPVSLTKVSGQNATFTAVFGGSALTYTWKKGATVLNNDLKYAGATSASLTVSNLISGDADTYTITATDANGGTATSSATLTISPSKAWTGGGTDDNWSTAANWGGTALLTSGESAVFGGGIRLQPVMNGSYDVAGLLFSSTAGAFNLTNSSGSLTLSGTLGNESANLQTISLPLVLNAPQTIDIGAPVTIRGSVSGSGDLTKIGAGTLTLLGTNTHTGAININAGTLSVSNGAAISDAATVSLVAGGVLSVDGAETIGSLTGPIGSSVVLNKPLTIGGAGGTYTGGISGSTNLEIAVSGTQSNNSATTYTGRSILTAGTLSVNDASTFGNGTGALQFNGGTLFRASQTTAQTWANPIIVTANSTLAGNPIAGARQVIFSAASMTVSNAATLLITNTATAAGGTLQVRFTGTSANCNVPLVLAGTFGAVELVATNNATGTQVISGNISGNGKVVKNGTANVRQTTLSGNNSFTGGLDLLGGRINLNHNNAAGSGTINIAASPATADLNTTLAGIVISNNIILASGAKPRLYANGTGTTLELAGVISGSGAICRDDGGTGTLTISGDNTFSGGTFITNRTIVLGHKNALGTGTVTLGPDITTSAPTLQSTTDLTGPNAVVNPVVMLSTNFTLSGANNLELSGDFSLGTSPRSISVASQKILSGVVSGSTSLTKVGTGTLTLTRDNTYDGGTIVTVGVLAVNNVSGSGTGSGSVTVNTNATLAGSGTVAGLVTVNDGGILNAGGVGTAGLLTLSGGADLSLGGTYKWELPVLKDNTSGTPGIDFDELQGVLTLGGNSKLVISFPDASVTPDFTNSYWASAHKWTIAGAGSNPSVAAFGSVQTAATNYAGTFSTATEIDGSISLSFAPAGPTAPIITAQPQSKIVVQGTNATFSVSATGTAPLSYQWYFGVQLLGGETNATLSITNAQPSNEGSYHVQVINPVNSQDSSNATLTVIVPPVITTQPQSQTVDVGATNVSFSVTASGTAPLYQWKKGGSNIGGATNSVFTIATVTTNDAASYSVLVTNLAGFVLSSNAVLSISTAQPPLLAFGVTNQTGTLIWSSTAGRVYRPQFKTDLSATNWTDIPPDITASGSTSLITNNIAGTNAAFYRVILLP